MSSPQPATRRYGGKSADQRQSERRNALVGAALEIWQEQGWAAVTMRGVCARAALTDRYFYESFANRDELLATVWDQLRDETLAMVLRTVAERADEPALDQLRAALHVVVHHINAEPARAQILFGDHAGSAVLEQRRRQTVQQATDILIDLAHRFLRDDTDEATFRIYVLLGIGGFVETMLAWRSGLIDADADALVDHLADIGSTLSTRFLRPEGP
ncbi:TetR/AcrR family transcriptional regulator [Amycolatopsis suaedae]|uniref:TetR/AcrR family transcriptional regulator n=1 Tax=Amycolatopsis suaedae TaxID=2510978 RepID=A0A4Q7JCL6_9PSEU|nr:TetR/AcrR family transcriptional regulator [Amycolatopsis suaedae]RZQ65641.1 TetR/AcrR family transcriptional regulator [Amycolatopsis suaedae]